MYEDRALYVCASDGNQCERRKGTPLRIVQIKILLDVSLLFGALGLLDEGLMNSFL